MGPDRVARSLASLGSASSSRVFNLCAIALAQTDNPQHAEKPFFESRVLNSAILLKHRLRADETQLFGTDRAVATKIIIPFQKTDLRMGGQSFFVGQRSFEVLLREVGNYRDDAAYERDLAVLGLLDRTPSLDPFMLREQLRSHGVQPDGCYFAISSADQQRIHAYAAKELRRLTSLAGGTRGSAQNASTSRMVTALLSNDVGEKLEPLRETLALASEEFSEGVFSWRGFIYYKWTLQEFWPELIAALREVRSIQPVGQITADQRAFFTASRNSIIRSAKTAADEVTRIIGIYDGAYGALIEQQKPQLFREFLLEAPMFFLEIGDKLGAMQHVTSFWKYRFPRNVRRTVSPDELTAIFQDFRRSFGEEEYGARSEAWAA